MKKQNPSGILGSMKAWERDRKLYLKQLKKREAAERKAITASLKAEKRQNRPKIKRAPTKSGWMKATAVKFVTRNGKRVVLIRKPRSKR